MNIDPEDIYGSADSERDSEEWAFEDEWPAGIDASSAPEPTSGYDLIHVQTEAFNALAIGMYQMPSGRVLDVISTGGQSQLPKMVDLFKLSLMDPSKASYLEVLTFEEMSEVVGQWVRKSMPEISTLGFPD
jgi:hypothetical protein